MSTSIAWPKLAELSESDLRVKVLIPIIAALPNVYRVNDVHGRNEKGLDVIFFEKSAIAEICYGLQLKKGNISGGGTQTGTVKQIVDQLELARDLEHSVAVEGASKVTIDRFIVATSGSISDTAREEIASRVRGTPVVFWTGATIEKFARSYMPELFSVADGAAVAYLKRVIARHDMLETLDQIPGVASRTLSQVYEEPVVRRRFDPTLVDRTGQTAAPIQAPALRLCDAARRVVIIADQDGGKTSLLKMLAMHRARTVLSGPLGGERQHLPVFLRASEIVGSASVVASIRSSLDSLGALHLVSTLEDDIESSGYLLLVDGFSELPSEADKDILESLLCEFAQSHDKCGIVVAGRPADFLTTRYFTGFQHYVIEDFSQTQVASLLNRWTSDTPALADVAKKLARRVREALQLPGSPICATIGVMLYEKERRFITNTAEAVDRYMAIRLGRYAHELGMRQQVDWTRKQDVLAEIAFAMVRTDRTAVTDAEFIASTDAIYARLGEEPMGGVILTELLEGGVLVRSNADHVSFHRLAFRDFFAAHGVHQLQDRDEFFVAHLLERKWGLVLTFAAGLKRRNGELLERLLQVVRPLRERAVGTPADDYFYGVYLLGRILSNSETTDSGPRVEVLRECAIACELSLPQFVARAKEQFGNVGELAALLGVEQSFFLTVGVPWLSRQLGSIAEDESIVDEQRYLAASTFIQLGGALHVVDELIASAASTRVLVGLKILLTSVMRERRLNDDQRREFKRLLGRLERRLRKAPRKSEFAKLLQVRGRALLVETERMKRLEK